MRDRFRRSRVAGATAAALTILLAGAASALPTDIWFVGDGPVADLEWDKVEQWHFDMVNNSLVTNPGEYPQDHESLSFPDPAKGITLYVTGFSTGLPPHLSGWNPSVTVDLPGETIKLWKTYIGGWQPEFDAHVHGNANQYRQRMFGELTIYAGTLEHETDYLPANNLPSCGYVRVGARGARGTIRHIGGTIDLCSDAHAADPMVSSRTPGTMTIGYDGPSSRGEYMLGGSGEFKGLGMGIGTQGFGHFYLNQGTVVDLVEPPTGTGENGPEDAPLQVSFVGRGYGSSDAPQSAPVRPYIPATGLAEIRGGTMGLDNFIVGADRGSVGHVQVMRDPTPGESELSEIDADVIQVGTDGNGRLALMGGTVRTGQLILGVREGSSGLLTVRSGTLDVTTGFFYNGRPLDEMWGGRGHVVIVGGEATIDLGHTYYQNADSRLSVVLHEQAPHVSEIDAAQYGQFETGATIDIRPAVASDGSGTNLFPSLTEGQEFVLVSADIALLDENGSHLNAASLQLSAQSAAAWQLLTKPVGGTPKELVAKYCPNNPTCP